MVVVVSTAPTAAGGPPTFQGYLQTPGLLHICDDGVSVQGAYGESTARNGSWYQDSLNTGANNDTAYFQNLGRYCMAIDIEGLLFKMHEKTVSI